MRIDLIKYLSIVYGQLTQEDLSVGDILEIVFLNNEAHLFAMCEGYSIYSIA